MTSLSFGPSPSLQLRPGSVIKVNNERQGARIAAGVFRVDAVDRETGIVYGKELDNINQEAAINYGTDQFSILA